MPIASCPVKRFYALYNHLLGSTELPLGVSKAFSFSGRTSPIFLAFPYRSALAPTALVALFWTCFSLSASCLFGGPKIAHCLLNNKRKSTAGSCPACCHRAPQVLVSRAAPLLPPAHWRCFLPSCRTCISLSSLVCPSVLLFWELNEPAHQCLCQATDKEVETDRFKDRPLQYTWHGPLSKARPINHCPLRPTLQLFTHPDCNIPTCTQGYSGRVLEALLLSSKYCS